MHNLPSVDMSCYRNVYLGIYCSAYINSLLTHLTKCIILTYADDTVLYCSVRMRGLSQQQALAEDVERTALRFRVNKLFLNPPKSKSLLSELSQKLWWKLFNHQLWGQYIWDATLQFLGVTMTEVIQKLAAGSGILCWGRSHSFSFSYWLYSGVVWPHALLQSNKTGLDQIQQEINW